jgi:hypothetical protein
LIYNNIYLILFQKGLITKQIWDVSTSTCFPIHFQNIQSIVHEIVIKSLFVLNRIGKLCPNNLLYMMSMLFFLNIKHFVKNNIMESKLKILLTEDHWYMLPLVWNDEIFIQWNRYSVKMAFGEFFFVEVQKSSCLSKRDEVFFFF